MAPQRSAPVKSVRDLVREQRDGLYASGHQNLNMSLPTALVGRIDAWKSRYRLGSRDAVVARVIRQCMSTITPDSFVLHAKPRCAEMRRISPIVAADLAAYVKRIQDRFHGIAYGPVFEMIADRVGPDLCGADIREAGVDRLQLAEELSS